MAERRMFTKKVTDDDNFIQLPSTAQALYLHLTMSADDDGFCNQVAISMFKAHASEKDLEALLEKHYLIQFPNGVLVIKHWHMANTIRKDRYSPTSFKEELAELKLKDNGAYRWLPDGCQMVAKRLPQYSIDKNSIDKDSIEEREGASKRKRFVPPTLQEVKAYCKEQNYTINPEAFIDFYTAKGWKVGNQSMKDWQAAVRTWVQREEKEKAKKTQNKQYTTAADYKAPVQPKSAKEVWNLIDKI